VNKDVVGFMMAKQQRTQQEKQQELVVNVNKLAKDFKISDAQKGAKGSDKVPEHAKLVVDDEKLAKELLDLKRRLKELNLENIKVCSNVQMLEKRKREKQALVDKIMQEKRLVNVNGEYVAQPRDTIGSFGIKMSDIPDYDKL